MFAEAEANGTVVASSVLNNQGHNNILVKHVAGGCDEDDLRAECVSHEMIFYVSCSIRQDVFE